MDEKFLEKIFFSVSQSYIKYWNALRYRVYQDTSNSLVSSHVKWIEEQADNLKHQVKCSFCPNLATSIASCDGDFLLSNLACDNLDCKNSAMYRSGVTLFPLKYSSVNRFNHLADKKRFKEALNKIFEISSKHNALELFMKLFDALIEEDNRKRELSVKNEQKDVRKVDTQLGIF